VALEEGVACWGLCSNSSAAGDISLMKQQFVITHRYTVLQETHKSWKQAERKQNHEFLSQVHLRLRWLLISWKTQITRYWSDHGRIV